MAMGAGELTERIRLERLSDAADEGGGGAGSAWALVAEVWAKAWALRGRQQDEGGQSIDRVAQRFKIRWRADVESEDMRVVWGGRAYAIVLVADGGRQSGFLTLDCSGGQKL